MPFVSFPDTAFVELVYTHNGSFVENTLYFRKDTGWLFNDLADLCTDVFAWWGAEVAPLQSTSVALNTVRARDMSVQDGYITEVSPSVGNNGLKAGNSMPNNVTMTVKFSTGFAGRARRGRNYVIGLVEADITGDGVDIAVAGDWVGAYEALNAAVRASDPSITHVVASRANPFEPGLVGQTYAVVDYSTDRIVDSQRRRLLGRGL